MKRIVIMAIALLMIPNISGGRYYYRGVRYSPYAFSYNYPSGLVPYYVRYHPYAFSPQHPSGLIDMYSGALFPHLYYFPSYDCPAPIIVQPSTPRPSDPPEVKRITKPRKPREQDGKLIVYNYLRNKGFDVDIVDGFSFRNQTVSTIFLIRSQNWFIKYQNPELEKSLGGNPLWEKYKKRWEEKEKEYKAKGWKVGILNK